MRKTKKTLVPVTAAGKAVREAYRKTVTPEVWKKILARLVTAAEGGDVKSIELLVKLGGAGAPTSAVQNNYYYGDKQGPPPGSVNGKATSALPGSSEKVRTMRRRASRGEAMESPGDGRRSSG